MGVIRDIPMDHLGVFTVSPPKAREISTVVYEIARYKGGFAMTVRSNIKVENETRFPLEVLLNIGSLVEDTVNTASESIVMIEPHGYAYLPVNYNRTSELRFRPDSSFEWSKTAVSCRDILNIAKHSNLLRSKQSRTVTTTLACMKGNTHFLYGLGAFKTSKGTR